MKKRVCVFTGGRAEFGLLQPLICILKDDADFEVKILASGMHTAKEHGLTYQEITKAGIKIDALVKILSKGDTTQLVATAIGTGITKFTKILNQWKPDIVVILGDRYEALAMAISAMLTRTPIAHLHGGEATFGLMDEAIRHAITKMSHLHFTSTEEYRLRVIQLGEDPKRVFNVGAIGIDNIRHLKLLTREELEKKVEFRFDKRNLLVTFHPVTLHPGQSKKQFQVLLDVLKDLPDTRLIFTKANADMEGSQINHLIEKYVKNNKDTAVVFSSMGQLAYLSAMKYVDAVVGNSSSGIIEAPSFQIGTINIGDRQAGRIRAGSVIDCSATHESIKSAFGHLYSDAFQKELQKVTNPYGKGQAAAKIVNVLKKQKTSSLLIKRFFDLNLNGII